MVQMRIAEILQEKEWSKYRLLKTMNRDDPGISYQNMNKIINNQTSGITFDMLDRLSKALEVPVGNLFKQN